MLHKYSYVNLCILYIDFIIVMVYYNIIKRNRFAVIVSLYSSTSDFTKELDLLRRQERVFPEEIAAAVVRAFVFPARSTVASKT